MSNEQKGILILNAVPAGDVEQKVIIFLTKFAKHTTSERIAEKVKQTPYILSKNIPAENAFKIVEALQKLGASAVFVPHTSAGPSGDQVTTLESASTSLPSPPHPQRKKPLAIQTVPQNGRRRFMTVLLLLLLLSSLSFLIWQLWPVLAHKLQGLGIL